MPEHEEQLEALFKRYFDRLVRFLVHTGAEHEDARDLAQETFLRVYKGMDAYRGDAEWTFLKITAKRLAINRARDNHALKRSGGKAVPLDETIDPGDPARLPDDALILRDETARFTERYRKAIHRLPPRTRQYFLLREQGYSYEQIAETLKSPINSVKSGLHEAKRRLREELGEEPQGIDWSDAAGGSDERQK
jgi:RNA polymerase sigma-70 factor (ECF subfamily)